jgi:transposase
MEPPASWRRLGEICRCLLQDLVGLPKLAHLALKFLDPRGQRDLRRLFIIGASAVVRWASIHGAPAGSWLERMLAKKPRMLVAVALANKMARIAWALMVKREVYRAPAPAT